MRRLAARSWLEAFPFAVLAALALVSLVSRVWLMAKPWLAAAVGKS